MNTPHQQRPKVVNLGRVADIDLEQVPALADCHPGMLASEYNVIIAPAIMPEKIGSILIADQTKESLDMAMQVGLIADQSPIAHNYDKWPKERPCPQIGDVVWFGRYAGGEFTGADGRTYRIIKDKDVGAIVKRYDPGEPQPAKRLKEVA